VQRQEVEAAAKEERHIRSDAPNFTWQEVYDVLQHAAAQHPPGAPPSVTSMLAEKRSRTAMSHINPVVMPRLKKY
jgi:hypothetical protein